MKLKILSISVLAIAMMACQNANLPSTVMPSREVQIEKIQKARLNPDQKFFEGQVQIALENSQQLEDFVSRTYAQTGVALRLLDRVAGRPIYLFEFASSQSPEKVAQLLLEDSAVVRASPNYEIRIEGFNDPDLSKQWSMRNYGQEAPRSLAGRRGADSGLPDRDYEAKVEVVVAVVDTGIDYLHEDLAVTEQMGNHLHVAGGNIWKNPDEIPANGVNDDNNGDEGIGYVDDVYGYDFVGVNGSPMDDHGHGTHVAGVIGALRNNFKGIVGINKSVKMMGVRFLGATGGGSYFAAVKGISYVIDMKKRFPEKKFLMNCSWGGTSRFGDNEENDFLMAAFQEAADNDILTVAAAGNSSLSTRLNDFFPANYAKDIPEFISVAATNNIDQIADFSNYGSDSVDIAAPGVLIYSTLPGNKYEAWSGTSMAAPHVAGAAALVWSQNPQMSARDVKRVLLSSVDIVPQLQGYVSSNGRLNIRRAVEGDFNIFPTVQPVIEKIAKRAKSPQITGSQNVDHVTELHAEGAKDIAVCFDHFKLDDSIDWIQIYGSDYRIRDIITGTRVNRGLRSGKAKELCSAPVPGDRIFVRLYSSSPFAGGGDGIGPRRGFETESLKVTK